MHMWRHDADPMNINILECYDDKNNVTTREHILYLYRAYKYAQATRMYYLDTIPIIYLPSEIVTHSRMLNLSSIHINESAIKVFPQEIIYMINLKELTLSGCDLQKIPSEISMLTNLKILNLSYNKIITIPKSISSLTQLDHIFLNCNNIQKIPDSFLDIIIRYVERHKIDNHVIEIVTYGNPVVKKYPYQGFRENGSREQTINLIGYLTALHRKKFLMYYFGISLNCTSTILEAMYVNGFVNHGKIHYCEIYNHHTRKCEQECSKCIICTVGHKACLRSMRHDKRWQIFGWTLLCSIIIVLLRGIGILRFNFE